MYCLSAISAMIGVRCMPWCCSASALRAAPEHEGMSGLGPRAIVDVRNCGILTLQNLGRVGQAFRRRAPPM
jgi:hypothetical protein